MAALLCRVLLIFIAVVFYPALFASSADGHVGSKQSRSTKDLQHAMTGKPNAKAGGLSRPQKDAGQSSAQPRGVKTGDKKQGLLSGRAYYNLGINLLRLGNWRDATIYLNKAKAATRKIEGLDKALKLADNQAIAEELLRYAESNRHIRNWKAAKEYYRLAIRNNPNLSEAYSGLGFTLAQNYEIKEALIAYEMAIKIDPSRGEAYEHLGILHEYEGDDPEAIEAFTQATKQDPKEPTIFRRLGVALQRSGRSQEAIQAYETMVKIQPDNPGIFQTLADLRWQIGDRKGAMAAYRTVIALKGNTLNIVVALGDEYTRRNNERDRQLAIYNLAKVVSTGSYKSYVQLADELKGLGDSESALWSYDRAIELEPGHPEAHRAVADLCWEKGDDQRAAAAYRTVIALKGNTIEAVRDLANNYNSRRSDSEKQRVLVIYTIAQTLHPEDANFHAELGTAFKDINEISLATDELRNSVRLAPHEVKYRQNLAKLLVQSGATREAIEELIAAKQLEEGNVEIRESLADAYARVGDLENSSNERRELTQLEPLNVTNHFQLAVTLEKLGRTDEAISEYRVTVALNPSFEQSYEARAKILELSGNMVAAHALREQEQILREQEQVLRERDQALREQEQAIKQFLRGEITIINPPAEAPGGHPAPPQLDSRRRVETANQSVYWNTWFEDPNTDPGPITFLQPNKDYEFTLAIGPYEYAQFHKGTLSSEPSKEIQEILDKLRAPTIVLQVLPILGGRGLTLSNEGEAKFQPFTVNMDALRHPSTASKPSESFRDFHARVNAGSYRLHLSTTEPGCSQIAIAIWDFGLNRPLEVVVHNVAIVTESGNLPLCWSQKASGRDSGPRFLKLPPDSESQPNNMALQIFQTLGTKSVGVYVDKKDGVSSVFSWSFNGNLGEFLNNAEFLGTLQQARNDGNYLIPGGKLADVLFSGTTDKDRVTVTQAQSRMREGVESGGSASLYATYIQVSGATLFLPIGMLPLGTSSLSDKVRLIQPLPTQTLGEGRQCISDWTFVLPRELAEVSADLETWYDKHRKVPDLGRIVVLESYNSFRSYVTSKPQNDFPEGLVVLAHHDQGNVWFENPNAFLPSSVITRHFPAGSVAILASCGTGDTGGHNKGMPLLTKLNAQGIDALVLSPFDVPIDLGVAFAIHFLETVIEASKVMQEQPTKVGPLIAELFERAASAVRSDTSLPIMADPKQEFVFAGDSTLRLCLK